MKKFFAAVLMLSLAAPAFSQDIVQLGNHFLCRLVYVPANVAYTDAGFDVAVGDTVEIQARGFANGVTDLTQWGWAGPEGRDIADNQFPLPGKPSFSCIGRVGIAGQPFYVGGIIVFRVNTAGRLYLGINDFIVNDNLGTFTAYVYKKPLTFTGVNKPSGTPVTMRVDQNFPNPFNPSTTITFETPQRTNVQINIYNSLAQLVRSLLSEPREAGKYSVVWDGRDNAGSSVSSGTYFYQTQIGDMVQAKKMILLK